MIVFCNRRNECTVEDCQWADGAEGHEMSGECGQMRIPVELVANPLKPDDPNYKFAEKVREDRVKHGF